MPMIFYTDADGNQSQAEVPIGQSVMQGAVDNDIDGILAECGGACVCATCHCYIDEAWRDNVGPAGSIEQEMLDDVCDPQPNSRLSCQIKVTAELDGLSVRLPRSQY